jgi:acyl dehydratase
VPRLHPEEAEKVLEGDWRSARITDEAIAEMRRHVGVKQPITPWTRVVTAEALWHFALGLGDDNPLWWDGGYASGTKAGRMFAPPSFLYAASTDVPNPRADFGTSDVEWLPGVMGLWAGDRWRWFDRIWVDEAITATRELHSVSERQMSFGGRGIVQTELLRFMGDGSRTLAEAYRTVFRVERQSTRSSGKNLNVPVARYSPEKRQAIIDQYAREASQRRGAVPRFWDEVQVGDELPAIVKGPLTLTGMIGWLLGWGSPGTPTNRMLYDWLRRHPAGLLHNPETGIDDTMEGAHWDEYLARESGMARGFDFGSQRIASAIHLLTDWCGDDGEVLEIDARIKAPNFLGDTTWFAGKVTAKELDGERAIVGCAITATNQRDEMTLTATARVALPIRSR